MFCAFIDFSKAFDRVNFWKLFHKLLDDGVAVDIVPGSDVVLCMGSATIDITGE